jgi:hypothetical protein
LVDAPSPPYSSYRRGEARPDRCRLATRRCLATRRYNARARRLECESPCAMIALHSFLARIMLAA